MKFSYAYSYKDPCENDFLERINEDEYEDLLLEQYADFLKNVLEDFPFYSQCFLMTGMSFERWIIICKPHIMNEILSKRRRLIILILVFTGALIFPTAISVDHAVHENVRIAILREKVSWV